MSLIWFYVFFYLYAIIRTLIALWREYVCKGYLYLYIFMNYLNLSMVNILYSYLAICWWKINEERDFEFSNF